MNRKSIIVYTIIAVVLLCGVGFLFFHLYKNEETHNEVAISNGVAAIPSDAIFLFESDEFETLKEMTDDGSTLKDFFNCIPHHSSKWKSCISLHYSTKNRVSPLFVLEIPKNIDGGNFIIELRSKCLNVINKKYNSHIIYKSSLPDISFVLYKQYLIASPSLIIVESSLRHLDNESSLQDNPLYKKASPPSSGCARVDICNQNLGKLFSGVANVKYLHYAGFAQNFADWAAFSFDKNDEALKLNGRFFNESGTDNFSNVLLSQKERKADLFSIVPFDANFAATIILNSYEDYLASYKSYLEANKKIRDYDYINVITAKDNPSGLSTFDMMKKLAPKELSLFSINDDKGIAKTLLAINCDNASFMKIPENVILPFQYRGYIPAVFGEVFSPSTDSHSLLKDDWLIIGGENELKLLQDRYSSPAYFSIEEYLSQTPAEDELKNQASFIALINTGLYSDSLSTLFRGDYSKRVSNIFGKKNFEFIFIDLQNSGSYLDASLALYSENLSAMPEPKFVKKSVKNNAVADNVPIEIFKGPYKVKNFKDGSTNYLEQRDNLDIRLLDSARHPVWTIKFDGKICGTVRQIDYLRNNKLQMLFGSGSKVYLLDRLGRKVAKFPVTLEKEILLGPDVYDFSENKNYSMVILHKDNTIGMYDLAGKKISGWNFVSPPEKIISLPELVMAGNTKFWVIRTSCQTLIYNDRGLPAADFSKKNRLRKESAVTPVSPDEISVTTIDGRDMLLNVKNGTFRKR